MTDNEKKFKAAFMMLLNDYQSDIDDFATEYDWYNDYCHRYCPFCEAYRNDACPARIQDSKEDYEPVDDDKCREEIFKWYLWRVTKQEDDLCKCE